MTYSKVETYVVGNCIVTVRHPDLTEEERKVRIAEFQRAASNILMEMIDRDREIAEKQAKENQEGDNAIERCGKR